MHTAEATAWLEAPPAVVAEMFWDMATWSRVWDPIERVEVTYQDPYQQEFVMEVERDGAVELVRTIRYRKPDGIELFSPQPPPMMTVHRGWWLFRERSGGTEVTAQRRYLLAAGHPDAEGFRVRFSARLRAILDQFVAAASGAGGRAVGVGGGGARSARSGLIASPGTPAPNPTPGRVERSAR